jgi:hypothetical protein
MIGIDPDGYATYISQIVASGSTDLVASGTYSTLATFPILGAVFAEISGLPASDAMILFPVGTGILFSIFAYLFGRMFIGRRSGLLAATLVVITTQLVSAGYAPFAQTLGVVYFVVLVYAVYKYVISTRNTMQHLSTVVILLICLTFTHRLTSFITTIFSIALLLYSGLRQAVGWSSPIEATHRLPLLVLVTLSGCFFFIHSMVLTTNFQTTILAIVSLLTVENPASPPVRTFDFATSAYAGPVWVLIRRNHTITLLVTGGLAWLTAFWAFRTRRDIWIHLAATAALLVLFPLSLLAPGSLRYTRVSLLLAPFLVVVISAVAVFIYDRNRGPIRPRIRAGLVAIGVILFVISQLVSPAASPDHPLASEMYLDTQEVDAKEFGFTYTPAEVYTDDYYAYEDAYPDKRVQASGHLNSNRVGTYQSLQGALFESNQLSCYPSVLYRTGVDIYRYHGTWRLNWDPGPVFDQKYDRVYDNGEVRQYTGCDLSR